MRQFILLLTVVSFFSLFAASSDKDTVPIGNKKNSVQKKEFDPTEDTSALGKKDVKAKDVDAPAPNVPYIASVSIFGTSRINEGILREFLGKDFDQWIEKGLKGDDSSLLMEQKIIERVKAKYGFPFAEFSIVQFFDPGDYAVHITLDVVEKKDVEKRMSFLPAPTQEFKDPDGLIKLWGEYENTALDLLETDQIQPEVQKCQALHCPFGHKHAKLKKYESLFVNGVKKNKKALLEIQSKDKRSEYRAAATYLLPYLNDGPAIIPGLIERVRDNDALVRNNALRVLGDITEKHKEFDVPIRPLLPALAYPKTSDRSKAIYAIFHLASNSEAARDEILKRSVPELLDLLDAKQPDQKEFAFAVLRKVSGKDFTINDVQSWRNWYTVLNKERGIAKDPAPEKPKTTKQPF